MHYVLLVGRICYSLIFILAAVGQFAQGGIDYAMASGVPLPLFFVPLSGLVSLLGGLSILLGYRAKVGAWMLVVFLVPITLFMHNFWGPMDPQMAMIQRALFFKNVSMLGGALIIAYFGTGPLSLCRPSRKK